MPTEEQNSIGRSHRGVSQGVLVLALMPPLKILAPTLGVALLVWGLLFVYISSPAWAAEITVNTTTDERNTDGDCSLREAIDAANTNTAVDECAAGTGEDTIVFDLDSPATITLDASLGQLPTITDAAGLTIDGQTADITVSGNDQVRVFSVGGGAKLALENLTVSHGLITDGRGGGANNVRGTLTISNSTFSDNRAALGSFSPGGGVATESGTVIVRDSTFSDNRSLDSNNGGSGGGIYSLGSTTTVTNSTFSGNRSGTGNNGVGGAINNTNFSTLTVTNSTFSGNSAGNNGGAIRQAGDAVTVLSSTFVANSALLGDSIYTSTTPATLRNTLLVNNPATSGGNCAQPMTDGGYNIDDGTSCGFSTANNSQPSTDPLLDPAGLQENGGPTKTIALQPTSPAIDAIPSGTNGCGTDVATDQRGVERPQDGNGDSTSGCDIGAFEVDTTPPSVTINTASGQDDPTSTSPIHFTAVFDEPVSGFTNSDVNLSGTAAGTLTAAVTKPDPNDSTTYDVAVSGMTSDGTVIASIPANVAEDFALHGNTASTSTDNTVDFNANSAPTAENDSYTTNEDTPLIVAAPGVLANDADEDGDALTAELVSTTSNGDLTLNNDGSFTYTPDDDFNGSDSFTYKDNDGSADSGVATVTITVTSVNDAPSVEVAAGGSCGTNLRSGTINLTVNDPDGPAGSLLLSATSNNTTLVPASNVTFGGSDASRTLTATAVSGKTGTATITVTVSDGTATGTVALTLKAGGNSNDTLTGASATDNITDILLGQNGNDTLRGLGGKDLLCGARGNDRLSGGADADRFEGGSGTDTATDFTASQGDTRVGIP
jgi:CSLREA domain-containing protein